MDKNVNMMKKWLTGFISNEKQDNIATTSNSDLENRWTSFFNHFPDHVIKIDRSNRILYMNRPITQKPLDQIIGTDVMSHLQPVNQDVLRLGIQIAFNEGRESVVELPGNSKNEWFLVRIVPMVENRSTSTTYLFITNISTINLHESNLLGISDFIKSEEEFKRRVLTTISHEIMNPMHLILNYIDFLGESGLRNEQKEDLDVIKNSSKNLLFVLNEILDFSKITTGQFSLKKEDFNLDDLVNKVINQCKLKADLKKLTLQSHNFQFVKDTLIGDKEQIEKVLFHLIDNAIKFTENGGIDVTCKLLNQIDKNLKFQIIVQDTGIGIEKKNLERILRSFTQEDEKISRQYSGLGIGLTILNHIVGLMDGKLEVKSEKGVGSSFILTLTLPISERPVERIFQVDYKLSAEETKKIKLLLVEDEPHQQKIAMVALKNWDVTIKGNGKDAVELLKNENNFDAILMDIRMPVMDGIEATKIIKSELNITTPIIAVSGEAFVESTIKECSEAGMVDFVSKPYEKSILIDCLVHNIKNRQLTIEKNEIIHSQHLLDGKKVLFVEDNAINQKVTRKLLEKLGCETEIAQDGTTAFRIIQNQDFDFFLLDLNLPDMSGYDVAKKLREMGFILPIIAYSGDDTPETNDKCRESGMDDLLLKPQKDFVEMGFKIYKTFEKRKFEKLYNFDSLIKAGFESDEIPGFVNEFLESIPLAIKNLSNALSENDISLLYRTAHNLKTTSLNFGIHSIRANLVVIEDFAKKFSTKDHIFENEDFWTIDQIRNNPLEAVNAELLIKNVIVVLNEVSKQLEKYLLDSNYVKKN